MTTQIVLLGTGHSRAAPERAGRATAIVIGTQAYLVDFGPGVVQRLAVAHRRGLAALDPASITRAFATNLRSAHTAGYPDLVFSPVGRKLPLEIYGPPGIRRMTEHVLAAWADEARDRRIDVHEVAPGVVYRDAKITVTAFGGGYRLETTDRKIVIRGDPNPSEAILEHCNGCDVLIHGVTSQNARQIAELATRARPELLVLHPHSDASNSSSEGDLIRELRSVYRGRFVVGHDLDVF